MSAIVSEEQDLGAMCGNVTSVTSIVLSRLIIMSKVLSSVRPTKCITKQTHKKRLIMTVLSQSKNKLLSS